MRKLLVAVIVLVLIGAGLLTWHQLKGSSGTTTTTGTATSTTTTTAPAVATAPLTGRGVWRGGGEGPGLGAGDEEGEGGGGRRDEGPVQALHPHPVEDLRARAWDTSERGSKRSNVAESVREPCHARCA